METLEKLLAINLIQTYLSRHIKTADIIINDNEAWLVFDIKGIKEINKKYKYKILKYLWGNIETIYETYIACHLLMQGYLYFELDGGWIITSPEGKEYQLQEHTCTCEDFLYNKKEKCKHLILKDFFINYRARCNLYKIEKYSSKSL